MLRPYRTIASRLTGLKGTALLVLRAVVGWLFILHALYKFHLGLTAFQNFMLKPAHLPLTGLLSWFVPTLELVAGVLLIIGLLTRVAAVLLATEMIFTGFVIKLSDFHTGVLGPKGSGGAELDILYLAALLLILMAGPGQAALDNLLRLEPAAESGTSGKPQAHAPLTTGQSLTGQ